jgi:hypothetical protein
MLASGGCNYYDPPTRTEAGPPNGRILGCLRPCCVYLKLHMRGFLRRPLLVLLAFGTVAAQAVCACPDAASANRHVPQAKQTCSGKGKCRVQDQPTIPASSHPQKGWPCERCNLTHRADQIQPERQDSVAVVHQPFLALLAIPLLYATAITERFPKRRESERVPIPPLLQDLFHSGTLLLI